MFRLQELGLSEHCSVCQCLLSLVLVHYIPRLGSDFTSVVLIRTLPGALTDPDLGALLNAKLDLLKNS